MLILTEKGSGDKGAELQKLNTRKQHNEIAMEHNREHSQEETGAEEYSKTLTNLAIREVNIHLKLL